VAPPTGLIDTNAVSGADTLMPLTADLSVTPPTVTAVVPGTSDSYMITVSNNGPSTVSSVNLTDASR